MATNNENLNMDKVIDADFEEQNLHPQGNGSNQINMEHQPFQMNQGNHGNQMNEEFYNHGQNMNVYNQNQFGNNQNMNMGGHSSNQFGHNQNFNMGDNNQGFNGQQGYNAGYQNNNMNYQSQGNGHQQNQRMQGQGMGYQGQNMNMSYQGNEMNNSMVQGMSFNNQAVTMGENFDTMPVADSEINEYKQRLRGLKEVQALTSEVDIQNTNSIINFGQQASDSISKISDELLNSMKAVKSEEASEMLSSLTKIMDKFDVKELEDTKKNSMFSKMFKGVGNTVAKLFQKYDTMGYEVQQVYVILKKYENDIRESNAHLKRLYDGNIEFYRQLEKYIVAGEMAIEEIDGYLNQIQYENSMNPEEKQMLTQKLQVSKDMMSQRIYDLQIAENVAIQAAPMIQTIQMSNFNLMRKINSSFIVTLPIFKQCLAQAVILKRQEIQAKSMKQLDDKTNELIMRNAANTARQSVEIAKMASTSAVSIETLQKSFETIMKGIEDTKAIQETNKQQRKENSYKLETIKADMKKHIAEA